MSHWELDFIKEEDFVRHVEDTISKYGDKLEPYNIKKFNSNIIDPIKMIFDKTVYNTSWDEIVGNEIFRQRDKSNNNDIGYFHQRIFQYFDKCHVPDNGKEGGWDVIYKNPEGVMLPEGDVVHSIYVEMKNKHNTMNSASAGKTYIKMQNQLLKDDDSACFLVEAIAKKSQNIKWETTVNGDKVSHKRIRRVSMDQFYALVTGDEKAFYKTCMVLPEVIQNVVANSKTVKVPKDTVVAELEKIAELTKIDQKDLAMAMAIYMLGFSSYAGFNDQIDGAREGRLLDRLYAYADKLGKD
ncbi:MAG: Eco47II family restriction endonuclease [Butyrivibrio sp.]|nr:Eco47II family restriction endonuclease [Butyrivibrio sp.]